MEFNKSKAAKVIFILYITAMAAMCVYGSFIPAKGNTWDMGAAIYYPENNSLVGREFNLNGNAYSTDDIDKVELLISPLNERITVEREQVLYNDEILHTLSTFKTPITLKEDGDFQISVIATDVNGAHTLKTIDISVKEGALVQKFSMFSTDHFLALLAIALVYFTMIIIYKLNKKPITRTILYAIISICIIVCDLSLKAWLLTKGVFKPSYHGIFHMCDISGFLTPVLLFMANSKGRKKLYNLMFIWGILGALMALLTPEMNGYGFPSLIFFNFFSKHGMIVIAMLLVTTIDKYSPKIKYLPGVMGISIAIVGVIYFINKLIIKIPPYEPGNFMFLSYPPISGSALDILTKIFGPSPYYITGMVILALVLWLVLWLVFIVIEKVKSLFSKKQEDVYVTKNVA